MPTTCKLLEAVKTRDYSKLRGSQVKAPHPKTGRMTGFYVIDTRAPRFLKLSHGMRHAMSHNGFWVSVYDCEPY